jgi:hypothetical protein
MATVAGVLLLPVFEKPDAARTRSQRSFLVATIWSRRLRLALA